jgi:hypothetical protein
MVHKAFIAMVGMVPYPTLAAQAARPTPAGCPTPAPPCSPPWGWAGPVW